MIGEGGGVIGERHLLIGERGSLIGARDLSIGERGLAIGERFVDRRGAAVFLFGDVEAHHAALPCALPPV